MADATDLKSVEVIPRAGSNPASGTIFNKRQAVLTSLPEVSGRLYYGHSCPSAPGGTANVRLGRLLSINVARKAH